ncbi:pseudouridine synthase [Agarivorans aestuarii]|uniref:Pseudouridine synthase n=1 Tax=Agarivorans aestuarii TaxID=1563703 RepID=A0ABU7FZF4_9ALTE|nr:MULTISPECIES: pseudouridine synthase [Agarivorans]MEE1672341.1 pseudouridine synthase [Agarivorans aestuarii]
MKYPCRLDKFLSKAGHISRSDAKKHIKNKRVSVNSQTQTSAQFSVNESDKVSLDSKDLKLIEHHYFMLNKPIGYLSTEAEANHPSALSLIDSPLKIHAAGRLDADTTGLLLLTSDGQWSHRVTSPNSKKFKDYRVSLADVVSDEDLLKLEQGLMLRGEDKLTLPAVTKRINQKQIVLSISEGRYHQVKRMCAAIGNKVVALHREKVGEVTLEDKLQPGEYRELTETEIASFN